MPEWIFIAYLWLAGGVCLYHYCAAVDGQMKGWLCWWVCVLLFPIVILLGAILVVIRK